MPVVAARKKVNFEQSMKRLDEIVTALERGEAPLEEAMKLFEEGSKLMRECTAALDAAEQKVSLLVADENGEPKEQNFLGEM